RRQIEPVVRRKRTTTHRFARLNELGHHRIKHGARPLREGWATGSSRQTRTRLDHDFGSTGLLETGPSRIPRSVPLPIAAIVWTRVAARPRREGTVDSARSHYLDTISPAPDDLVTPNFQGSGGTLTTKLLAVDDSKTMRRVLE